MIFSPLRTLLMMSIMLIVTPTIFCNEQILGAMKDPEVAAAAQILKYYVKPEAEIQRLVDEEMEVNPDHDITRAGAETIVWTNEVLPDALQWIERLKAEYPGANPEALALAEIADKPIPESLPQEHVKQLEDVREVKRLFSDLDQESPPTKASIKKILDDLVIFESALILAGFTSRWAARDMLYHGAITESSYDYKSDIMPMLLRYIDINARSPKGLDTLTPIFRLTATNTADPDRAKKADAALALMEAGAKVDEISVYLGREITPLFEALPKEAQVLLDHGADPNFENEFSSGTPLTWAISELRPASALPTNESTTALEKMRVLLNHPQIDVNKPYKDKTPLSRAVDTGNIDGVRLLLNHPDTEIDPALVDRAPNEEIKALLREALARRGK